VLAIVGGHILTITQGEIPGGTILMDGGKIVAVGRDLAVPAGAEIVDAAGKYVMPGLIDAHTHVGIAEEAQGWAGMDVNETTEPATPHLRAVDAINPEDEGFRDALRGGVTALMVNPGSANIIGGQTVALKTFGRTVDEMVLRQPAGLKAALGENPKRVYGDQKKLPSTRMGSAALLREWLVKGQNYVEKLARAEPDKPVERDLRLEAIAKVLRREMPLRLHAHRVDDIMTALRIQAEFELDITIEHCTEGYKVADELARRGIPALVGPTLTARTKVELRDRNLRTPGLLAKAGVKVAIITDHWVVPIQHLIVSVILAVKEGLDPEEALRTVTINPAEIMGVAERVGSLEPGKDADVQMLSGHPLDVMARPERVYVGGQLAYDYEAESARASR
jgi:imidazolonepropionase-like amidohydrolase